MVAVDDFFKAVVLTDRLRSDFAVLADLLGPDNAFLRFAAELTEPYRDDPARADTEERMVRLVRALYDDYVTTHPADTRSAAP